MKIELTKKSVAIGVGTACLLWAIGYGMVVRSRWAIPRPEPEMLFTTDDAPPWVATVVDYHIFYNNSEWDGNDAAANASDDAAIAPDKSALLPEQTATFANYTSYSRGINGIMIDIENCPNVDHITAADFSFRMGNRNAETAHTWDEAAPPSSVTVREGAGTNGSDRITLIWDDDATVVKKQWLRVEMRATQNTGLVISDVHYWGNAVGEVGNSTTNAFVNSTDVVAIRDNATNFLNPSVITDVHDINRSRLANATDVILARDNATNFLNVLQLITAPEHPRVYEAIQVVTNALPPGGRILEGLESEADIPAKIAYDSAAFQYVQGLVNSDPLGGTIYVKGKIMLDRSISFTKPVSLIGLPGTKPEIAYVNSQATISWGPDFAPMHSTTETVGIAATVAFDDRIVVPADTLEEGDWFFAFSDDVVKGVTYNTYDDGGLNCPGELHQVKDIRYSEGSAATLSGVTAAVNNVLTATGSHGWSSSPEPVKFSTTGTMPGGLVAGQIYWTLSASGSTFKVSTTRGGTEVDITSTGSAVTATRMAIEYVVFDDFIVDPLITNPRIVKMTGVHDDVIVRDLRFSHHTTTGYYTFDTSGGSQTTMVTRSAITTSGETQAHGFAARDRIRLRTLNGATVPTGINGSSPYYYVKEVFPTIPSMTAVWSVDSDGTGTDGTIVTQVNGVTTAHGLVVGDILKFTAGSGGLPAGMSAARTYYVRTAPTTSTLTISETFGTTTSPGPILTPSVTQANKSNSYTCRPSRMTISTTSDGSAVTVTNGLTSGSHTYRGYPTLGSLTMHRCNNAEISNCSWASPAPNEITLMYCGHTKVTNCSFENQRAYDTGDGYCVVVGPCNGVVFSDSIGKGTRHVFTTTAQSPDEGTFDDYRYGTPRNVLIDNVVARQNGAYDPNSTLVPFDTHGEGWGIIFQNCSVIVPAERLGQTSTTRNSNRGFQSRSRHTIFRNCKVFGQHNLAYGFRIMADDCVVENCHVSNCRVGVHVLKQNEIDVDNATVDASTDKVTFTAHGLTNGDAVVFDDIGASDLLPRTTYWVINKTADTFEVSLTYGGSKVNVTSGGTVSLSTMETESCDDCSVRYSTFENLNAEGIRFDNGFGHSVQYCNFKNVGAGEGTRACIQINEETNPLRTFTSNYSGSGTLYPSFTSTAHGLCTGDRVIVYPGGGATLPKGLVQRRVYTIETLTADTFNLRPAMSTESAGIQSTQSAGSGTLYVRPQKYMIAFNNMERESNRLTIGGTGFDSDDIVIAQNNMRGYDITYTGLTGDSFYFGSSFQLTEYHHLAVGESVLFSAATGNLPTLTVGTLELNTPYRVTTASNAAFGGLTTQDGTVLTVSGTGSETGVTTVRTHTDSGISYSNADYVDLQAMCDAYNVTD